MIKPPSPENGLVVECEVVDSVLLPALFVVLGAKRSFLAVADGSDVIGRNSLLHQGSLYCLCAAGTQCDVVFFRSAVVKMPFDKNLDTRMLRQEGFVILDNRRFVGSDVGFVVVEVHIFDVLAEQVLIAR